MITLAKHIELLLLEHDCVIVPGLGGFIANHADALYTGEQESLFLPPYRSIGFNQQLQANDGLLVQSYMTAYDTSYPFANLQMEKDVEKMMYELDTTGEYTLENIGTLKKGVSNNITFIAPETGALTPALYGLYSCQVESLAHVAKRKETERKLQEAAAAMQIQHSEETKTDEEKKDNHVVINLNHRWFDVAIAAAAAVVLLFCLSYPALKNAHVETDTLTASVTPVEKTPVSTKPTANKPKAEATKANKAEADKGSETEMAVKAKEATKTEEVFKEGNTNKTEIANKAEEKTKAKGTKAASAPKGKCTIVLASYVSQNNAETFLSKLSKEGFTEGKFVKIGKVSRILYAGYASEAEAQKALKDLRQQSAAFEEAWVMPL